MTVNKEGQGGKIPKKKTRVCLKWAIFNLSILLITLNNPDNTDNEDLESHPLKIMFKWEVQNCATALLYMGQGACALKIKPSCPDVHFSALSEQKLLLRINHKSGNTFPLSVKGLTTQAQLGVKWQIISLLLLYGSYGYASTYFSSTHGPENPNRDINIFSNLRLGSVFGSCLFQHFWTNMYQTGQLCMSERKLLHWKVFKDFYLVGKKNTVLAWNKALGKIQ